ncbi:hypothetical protein PtB15_17B96 [Puccinia triticina]|nr:hypothetical protein PtB15_17B96 [Puccinia triticina]
METGVLGNAPQENLGDPHGAVKKQTHSEKTFDRGQDGGAHLVLVASAAQKETISFQLDGEEVEQEEPATPAGSNHQGRQRGAGGQTINNKQVLKQLLNQSTLSPPPPPLKNQTNIKEVAHGVGSSIISSAAALPSVFTPNNTSSAPSSPSKLSMTASLGRKPNRTKLKIAKTNAAQLQAQLESQLSPKIDLRKIKNKYLLWTCSALKLQIFEVILPSTLSH